MADKCPTCGQIKRRSSEQNRRLHKLFNLMSEELKGKDGLYHPAAWWKVMSKDKWLGYDEYNKPDGSIIYVLKATSELDVEALTEFMNEVERYCALRGVYLQE